MCDGNGLHRRKPIWAMDGGMFGLTKRRFVLMALAVLATLFLILVWVATDPTFIVRGDEINLIENPNFDNPERGFAGWNVGGCATYVRPPKEGAAKAGPLSFDGGCLAGETAVISQTIPITGMTVLTYTHREILKGLGNRITVSLWDGAEWHTLRDTTQNGCFCTTPAVTTTLPVSTTWGVLEIRMLYGGGIGNKITDVRATGR